MDSLSALFLQLFSSPKKLASGKGGEITLGKNTLKAGCGCDLGWPESIY